MNSSMNNNNDNNNRSTTDVASSADYACACVRARLNSFGVGPFSADMLRTSMSEYVLLM